MVLYSLWESWGEKVGNGVRNHLIDSQSTVGKAVCNIYGKYPKTFPINPYAKGLMNAFCAQAGAPFPQPEPGEFENGGCPTLYRFVGTMKVHEQDFVFEWYTDKIQGQILSGVIKYLDNGTEYPDTYVEYVDFTGQSKITRVVRRSGRDYGTDNYPPIPGGKSTERLRYDTSFNPYSHSHVITELMRVDGQPDVCPENEEIIDDADFNFEACINVYDSNAEVIDVTCYDVKINQDMGDFFEATVNFGDSIINVDVGGISINKGGDNNSSGDGGGGGGGDNNSSGDGGGGGGGKTTKYKQPFDPSRWTIFFPGSKQDEEEEGEKELEEEEIIDGEISWVLVTVTQLPSKGKTILQNNADNNTYFAGYFSWIIEESGGKYRLEEQPIRKRQMAFKSPVDSLGYTVYTVNNAKISTRVYKQKIEGE